MRGCIHAPKLGNPLPTYFLNSPTPALLRGTSVHGFQRDTQALSKHGSMPIFRAQTGIQVA